LELEAIAVPPEAADLKSTLLDLLRAYEDFTRASVGWVVGRSAEKDEIVVRTARRSVDTALEFVRAHSELCRQMDSREGDCLRAFGTIPS
jgi:hypothetical protein